MSRICVKGLPPYADAAKLRATFGSLGTITDAKVVCTK